MMRITNEQEFNAARENNLTVGVYQQTNKCHNSAKIIEFDNDPLKFVKQVMLNSFDTNDMFSDIIEDNNVYFLGAI